MDHFGYSNEDRFQLRYLVADQYWDKTSGPIFLYTGNEGDIEWFCNNTVRTLINWTNNIPGDVHHVNNYIFLIQACLYFSLIVFHSCLYWLSGIYVGYSSTVQGSSHICRASVLWKVDALWKGFIQSIDTVPSIEYHIKIHSNVVKMLCCCWILQIDGHKNISVNKSRPMLIPLSLHSRIWSTLVICRQSKLWQTLL